MIRRARRDGSDSGSASTPSVIVISVPNARVIVPSSAPLVVTTGVVYVLLGSAWQLLGSLCLSTPCYKPTLSWCISVYSLYVCVCMFMDMFVDMSVCLYICAYVCIFVDMFVFVYLWIYVCVFVYLSICLCSCILHNDLRTKNKYLHHIEKKYRSTVW